VLGVDGCHGGWIGALTAGRLVRWLPLPTLADVLTVRASTIGIDMPIGMPSAGYRDCDLAARAILGRRAACVFLTPPRSALDAADYAAACAAARLVNGKAISRQTWNLLPRIRALDSVADDPRLIEVHPEVSFTLMTGAPLPPKATPDGQAARLEALGRWFDVDPPRGRLLIDALDALAVAWTATRWHSGSAIVLGGTLDAKGRPMRIVA
jgi:predicted RNase H-like nuclease